MHAFVQSYLLFNDTVIMTAHYRWMFYYLSIHLVGIFFLLENCKNCFLSLSVLTAQQLVIVLFCNSAGARGLRYELVLGMDDFRQQLSCELAQCDNCIHILSSKIINFPPIPLLEIPSTFSLLENRTNFSILVYSFQSIKFLYSMYMMILFVFFSFSGLF